MTVKVFWEDPYRTQLDTHVTSVNGQDITVAQTIFYALAGGQESDEGTIGDHVVHRARRDNLEIIYTLPENHGLKVGDAVAMKIDWERRYKIMRLHFAAEIVLELTVREIGPIEKIGAHISVEKARIDFNWPASLSHILPVLQSKANVLVEANHGITSAYSDAENERRYWEIAGFGRVACGGTHIKRTGEIGETTLKRKNIGKGKERIEIYVANIESTSATA